MLDFSLILPILNEEDIIERVVTTLISQLKKSKIQFEIILVENGSTDNTLKVARAMAKKDKRIRVLETKRGYGRACITGIRLAKGEYIAYMPSDGQIDASIFPDLWKEVQSGAFDVVKVYRKNRESRARWFRSKGFNILTRILYFPIPFIDINGSPKIVRADKLRKLDLKYTDSFIDTEFAVKARILKWKVKELPMKNLLRLGGKSTVRFSTVIEFFRNLYNFRMDPQFRHWKKLNKRKV
jgi:glycosyltransferase involved in cell wall biosynthesis